MASTAVPDATETPVDPRTAALAAHVAGARERGLPPEVAAKTRLHVLDTLAATLSGSRLEPGIRGAAYARTQGGSGATVLGTDLTASPATAALANGMSAHADETDDSHAASLSHPGCGVVPAALAVAEDLGSSGRDLLTAVAVGYDVGTRVVMALGRPPVLAEGSSYSTHALAGQFGAAAAAAVLHGMDAERVRWTLSYAAQSAGGVTSWLRDPHHVEKAFVFGGMPAANGVRAAELVASGCDGVADVFSGQPNYLDALSTRVDRDRLAAGLGERYEIIHTNIKKFAVGSPAQAAVQAVLDLVDEHGLTAETTASLEITLPYDLCRVVDDRDMPDINVQYLVAGTLIDGAFTFAMAHDDARMSDPLVRSLRERTTLTEDPEVSGVRCATLVATTTDGRRLRRHVPAVRGSVDDPMSVAEVEAKAVDLLEPVLGAQRTAALVGLVSSMDEVSDVRETGPLLR
ncbi:MmgE/PrpD family protein [Nocardiopsis sp. MG754419]|uniref:MmgE/PrpD family protein n=1 Tax=Nocardiopsis sp. MG754419 TaxID=2259865 RepID=UPI001BAC226A|nr:MmgE/PrpD family protein [Nocardiopsis sp. MG754419]MBR8741803.1 MmgE/PrpD family protein [Nocardiopsis sp. MG754419]